jgi:hypothetical protein
MTARGMATNKKIIDLFNMMKNNELTMNPEFQRNLVWNKKHKENFIDTILKGLPFPEVYFADGEIDLEKTTSKTLVVDGQQRLSTIYKYIIDDNDLKLKFIKRFSALSREDKTSFLDYSVVVRDLGRIEKTEIREIFKRINSVQYALNAMEINNSLYEGEYISTAKEISEKNILSRLEIFSENQYARMEDLEFVLLIMTTIEVGGYFSQDREIENYIIRYDDEYPNKELIKNDILSAIELVISLELEPDSIWLRKSSLFTLLVELIKFKRKKGNFPDRFELYTRLTKFGMEIFESKKQNPESNRLASFYNYMYQGTAYRKSRIVRGEILEQFVNSLN